MHEKSIIGIILFYPIRCCKQKVWEEKSEQGVYSWSVVVLLVPASRNKRCDHIVMIRLDETSSNIIIHLFHCEVAWYL